MRKPKVQLQPTRVRLRSQRETLHACSHACNHAPARAPFRGCLCGRRSPPSPAAACVCAPAAFGKGTPTLTRPAATPGPRLSRSHARRFPWVDDRSSWPGDKIDYLDLRCSSQPHVCGNGYWSFANKVLGPTCLPARPVHFRLDYTQVAVTNLASMEPATIG